MWAWTLVWSMWMACILPFLLVYFPMHSHIICSCASCFVISHDLLCWALFFFHLSCTNHLYHLLSLTMLSNYDNDISYDNDFGYENNFSQAKCGSLSYFLLNTDAQSFDNDDEGTLSGTHHIHLDWGWGPLIDFSGQEPIVDSSGINFGSDVNYSVKLFLDHVPKYLVLYTLFLKPRPILPCKTPSQHIPQAPSCYYCSSHCLTAFPQSSLLWNASKVKSCVGGSCHILYVGQDLKQPHVRMQCQEVLESQRTQGDCRGGYKTKAYHSVLCRDITTWLINC